MAKDDKELRFYKCYFCKYEFKQKVGRVAGNPEMGGKTRHVSSQVKCPNCGNCIKTWRDYK